MAAKTKIVLDADIIIHFIKGGQFVLLRGKGESACMVYCRDNYDVLISIMYTPAKCNRYHWQCKCHIPLVMNL